MNVLVDTEITRRLGSTKAVVFGFIKDNPKTSYKEIMSEIGLSYMGTMYAIQTLEEMRYIKRIFTNPNAKRRYWIDTEILK